MLAEGHRGRGEQSRPSGRVSGSACTPGMRRGEVMPPPLGSCRQGRQGVFRVDETKTGAPLELPVTRQLAAILDRRWAESGHLECGWVFPSSSSRTGYFVKLTYFHRRISEAGGAKFWFHGMRNCFITVAERELMLPHALTKRLVNHAPPNDVTEGYAADWTIEQTPRARSAHRGSHRGADESRVGQPHWE